VVDGVRAAMDGGVLTVTVPKVADTAEKTVEAKAVEDGTC
jgi:HSP20 family molecular chaperone IbpA